MAQRTVVGLFGSVAEAERTVRDAIVLGVSSGGIGLVATPDAGTRRGSRMGAAAGDYDYREERDARWVGLDRQLPGGLRFLVVPGLGQVVAGGPEAALLATGAGCLTQIGMQEEEARRFVAGVRQGLLLLLLPAGDAAEAAGILPGLVAVLSRREPRNARPAPRLGGALHGAAFASSTPSLSLPSARGTRWCRRPG